MPAANIIVFGYAYPQFNIVEQALGIDLNLVNGQAAEEYADSGEINLPEFSAQLKKAHSDACKEMGFKLIKKSKNYSTWDTPVGETEMSPFRFDLFYDPGEMEDDPEDAVVGVKVLGRYFPTFVDWREASGGSNKPRLPQKEAEIAKRHIIAALPWMAKAEYITLLRWF